MYKTTPYRAVHPGEILSNELEYRHISSKDLAKEIDMPESALNEFLDGKIDLTPELANKLQYSLGISAKSWMQIQKGYIKDLNAIKNRND